MIMTREQVLFIQARIKEWCRNSFHTITNGDVSAILTDARFEVKEPPKYDPCRLFKKGDEVEYRPKDGRANPNLLVGRKYKVSADEPCDSGIVQVEFDGLRHIDTFVAYNNLELVTPVEELEPYSVEGDDDEWNILRGGKFLMSFPFDSDAYCTEEQAKAAAEAECARLNAEHRKGQNNG